MANSKELRWKFKRAGGVEIDRKFTQEWATSGLINLDKLPEFVASLIEQRKSMIEYIEALHDKMDDIFEKNKICQNPNCHTANCLSDHQ